MKSLLLNVDDHGIKYQSLAFVCPGCSLFGGSGLHILPVNTDQKSPAWDWDGNTEQPTISPSILTGKDDDAHRCHSFLTAGVFNFLDDCTHDLKGQSVQMPDLPEWFIEERT
ncbi:MAG TPA: DUF6527 family protein [Patescibacteria group bacterium]|nr:DUF6527 family protein [Patescibacteria group bacterium]